MFEPRTVIRSERTSRANRIMLYLAGLVLVFIVGFVVAVKLLGHPLPEPLAALPEGKQYANTVDLLEDESPDFATRWKYDSLAAEIKCLADNIYFEGRGENTQGQIAIGLTTINRVQNKHFRDSICDVVWFQAEDRNTGKLTAHFSWTLDGESDRPRNKELYGKITRLASALLAEGSLNNIVDFTKGATHYHADYVKPYWAKEMEQVATLGAHLFYKG